MENQCKNCGRINTIWPLFRGRQRLYQCSECKGLGTGVDPEKSGIIIPIEQDIAHQQSEEAISQNERALNRLLDRMEDSDGY